jgi:hypothetical protein
MKQLTSDLITSKYTKVFHEENFVYNAPHHFQVVDVSIPEIVSPILGTINFQEGPVKECGINGVMNEDLIAMVICRLEHFQRSEFACRENDIAITKLEECLMWLRKRTNGRAIRGVEGTHNV